jgi:hypothetical protein
VRPRPTCRCWACRCSRRCSRRFAVDRADAGGHPVATLAIGKAGAINAALLSASILGAKHPQFHAVLKKFRAEQTDSVLDNPDPRIA